MSNERRRARGFTLMEVVMAIVIIGVGLAGVLSVFQASVRNSSDPVARKQLMSVAEEMLEEISLRPYSGASKQTSAACERAAFDDVSDYDAYPTNGRVCDIEGTAVQGLEAYTLAVAVTEGTLVGVPAKSVVVTVTRGTDSVTLTTWRTPYAQP